MKQLKKEEQILSESDVKDGTIESAEKKGITSEQPTGSLIYLGPNLPGGRLLTSTTFRDGIPVYMQPLLEEQPEITALIVPVDEISSVQARIKQKGTPDYEAYQAILRGGVVGGI